MNYPSVVIIGNAGHGKSTLTNKICKTNQETRSGGQFVTNNLFQTDSAYGNGFYVTDTPGIRSNKQIYHLLAILTALTQRPLNLILVTIRLDRLVYMIKNFKNILYMLNDYKDQICLVVTNWDLIDDTSEVEKEIKTQVIQKLGIKQYILSGKNTTGESLCEQIDKLLINTQKIEIQINETSLLSQYSIEQLDEFTYEMEMQFNKLQNYYREQCKICIQFIHNQDYNQYNYDKYEILHTLITTIRKNAHEIIDKFQNDNGLTFDLLLEKYNNLELAYLFPMNLKKIILEEMNEVIKLAQEIMMKCENWQIFKHLRKCPKCGEVWLNVNKSSCYFSVTCGAFSIQDDKEFEPQQPKYKIEIKQNEVVLKKVLQQPIKNWYNPFNIYNPINYFKSLKGCGYKGNWDNWIILQEQEVKELLNLGFKDVLCMTESTLNSQAKVQFQNVIKTNENLLKQQTETQIRRLPQLQQNNR